MHDWDQSCCCLLLLIRHISSCLRPSLPDDDFLRYHMYRPGALYMPKWKCRPLMLQGPFLFITTVRIPGKRCSFPDSSYIYIYTHVYLYILLCLGLNPLSLSSLNAFLFELNSASSGRYAFVFVGPIPLFLLHPHGRFCFQQQSLWKFISDMPCAHRFALLPLGISLGCGIGAGGAWFVLRASLAQEPATSHNRTAAGTTKQCKIGQHNALD